jgi:hypothetical protein
MDRRSEKKCNVVEEGEEEDDDDEDEDEEDEKEEDEEEVDEDYLEELFRIYPLCPICLGPMKRNKGLKKDSATVDRLFSEDKKYWKGRITPLCFHCNGAKSFLTGEDLAASPLFHAFGLRVIEVREHEIARYSEEKRK